MATAVRTASTGTPPRSRAHVVRRVGHHAFLHVACIAVSIVCVAPILVIAVASFKGVKTFDDLTPSLTGWTLASYLELFRLGTVPRWVLNTMIVCTSATVLTVLIDLMAAFAFAKLRFRFREPLFLVFISTMMLPFTVTLVPTYLIANALGLVDSYPALVLPGLSGPLGVFLLRQFLNAIPDELIEAAYVDGASNLRVFRSIIVPLSGQPIAILAILTFVANWNSFIWPLLVVQSDEMKTLTLGLATTSTQFTSNLGLLTATTMLSLAPMVVLFVAFQRYFLRGVAAGALKG